MRLGHIPLLFLLNLLLLLDTSLAATTLKLNKHRTSSAFLSNNMRRRYGSAYKPLVARYPPGSQGITTRKWYPSIPNRHRRFGEKRDKGFSMMNLHPRWEVSDQSMNRSKSSPPSGISVTSISSRTPSTYAPTTETYFSSNSFAISNSTPLSLASSTTLGWQTSTTRLVAAVETASGPSGSAPASSGASGASAASGSQIGSAVSSGAFSGSASLPTSGQPSGSQVSGSQVSDSAAAPPHSASAASTASVPRASPSDSSLPINANGVAYFVDLLVSPGNISVPVMVDTGSSTLWLAGTHCTTCTTAKMVGAVTVQDGCTSINPLTYGSGTVQGCMTTTTLQVGGYELVDYPTVGATAIDSVMAGFGDFISGIWGLGTHEGNIGDSPTPIDALYANNQITVPEVGFYLVRDEDPADSQIVIGDPTKVMGTGAGSLPIDTTKKVVLPDKDPASGHYVVTLEGVTIFGHTLGAGINVILDTGATVINVPSEFLDPIYAFLGNGTIYQDKATNSYILPCHMAGPEEEVISLKFGGMEFGMKFKDLISLGPVKDHSEFCFGAIVPTAAEGLWLIGDTFLVNVFHSVNVQTGELTMYGLKS